MPQHFGLYWQSMKELAVKLRGLDADHPVISSLNLQTTNRPDITIWNPEVPFPEAQKSGHIIALLDVGEDPWGLVHSRAFDHHASFADAYAGDRQSTLEAVEWLSQKQSPQRARAPAAAGAQARVTYLGGLGTRSIRVTIGQSFPLGDELLFGRSKGVHIGIRSGAHSDQNLCARRHARLTCDEHGLTIEDLRSTNGTYVEGVRIDAPTRLHPGQQFALAGYYRFIVG